MMAVGLRYSTQVMAYVPFALKEQMDQITAGNPEFTQSRIIREAVTECLPKIAREAKRNPSRPSRTSPKT